MRKTFIEMATRLMSIDERACILLGDIGVYSFNQVFNNHPNRIINCGIMEQTMVGIGAGLSINDQIPIMYTIAPFLVERAYEQIKVDFGYDNLTGNFVSVGASYDYSGLGMTHQCPADVSILYNIPNMEIIVPSNKYDFESLFTETYNRNPTYYRLSENSSHLLFPVKFGKGNVIRYSKNAKCTIVVVGTMLKSVFRLSFNDNFNILHYTTIKPFDIETLQKCWTSNIIVIEPFNPVIVGIIAPQLPPTRYLNIAINKEIDKYGSYDEITEYLGLDENSIMKKINEFLGGENIC